MWSLLQNDLTYLSHAGELPGKGRVRTLHRQTKGNQATHKPSCLPIYMWFTAPLFRSVSDTAVVAANCPTSPIQPRRSERLLALRNKAKEVNSSPQSKITSSKSSKEVNNSTGNHLGENSKDNTKTEETDIGPKKQQSPGKRLAKKSSSESDLAPKRKRQRAGSPEVKQDLLKVTIQRGTSKSASTNTKLSPTGPKKDKGNSEPTISSPEQQTFSHKGRLKDKTSKPSHKGKSAPSRAVGTRQLRKLKSRNLPAEMSSDE